jgi:hypothetical protein
MPVLRLGLMLAVLGCVYVAFASWSAGYPPEVALLRGIVAFMAFGFLGYIGELALATAPPRVRARSRVAPGDNATAADDDEGGGRAQAA